MFKNGTQLVIIKIYIAKIRTCATQVKLDYGGNCGTVTFIILEPKSSCVKRLSICLCLGFFKVYVNFMSTYYVAG